MRVPARQICPFAIALSLAVAGCGADDSKDPPAEPPTTAPPATDIQPQTQTEPQEAQGKQSDEFPAAFTKKVDSICEKARTDLDEMKKEGIEDPDTRHSVALLYENLATQLENQKAPPENAAAYERYVEILNTGAEDLGKQESAASEGDKPAEKQFTATLDDVNKRSGELSKKYGFKECDFG